MATAQLTIRSTVLKMDVKVDVIQVSRGATIKKL